MGKTPEMVERVARAICKEQFASLDEWNWELQSDAFRESYRDKARAAIEAMKEPTDAMIEASRIVSLEMGSFCTVADQYKTMLRQALET